MSVSALSSVRQPLYRAVVITVWVMAGLSMGVGCLLSWAWMGAVLAGSLCWFIPTCYMAYRLFRRLVPQAKQFLSCFFRAEIEKLIVVAVLFIATIKLLTLPVAGMLAGYLLAQAIFWVVLALSLQ